MRRPAARRGLYIAGAESMGEQGGALLFLAPGIRFSLSWPSLCTYYSVRVCVCVFLTLFSRRCLVAIDSAQGGRTDQRG